jgi:hypothetical protein
MLKQVLEVKEIIAFMVTISQTELHVDGIDIVLMVNVLIYHVMIQLWLPVIFHAHQKDVHFHRQPLHQVIY